MGRLRGFGLSGAALFLWRSSQFLEFLMKAEYEVGYGKPPKASRFGSRPQPNRSSTPRAAKAAPADLSDTINWITFKRDGVTVRMHSHEAMMHGLVKSGMRGKLRAMKEFFLHCKKAGLLEALPAQQTSGTIFAPKGVPIELAARLVRLAGPPPWDDELYDQCKAEYDSDRENIARLLAEEKERQNEKPR
jgi:hypothetical protein